MNLTPLSPLDDSYRRKFGDINVEQLDVYSNPQERVGTAGEVLTDETGLSSYLTVYLEHSSQKYVLLPSEWFQVDRAARRVYLNGLTRSQLIALPSFDPTGVIRRSPSRRSTPKPASAQQTWEKGALESSGPLESSVSLESSVPLESSRALESFAPLDSVSTAPIRPPAPVNRPDIVRNPAAPPEEMPSPSSPKTLTPETGQEIVREIKPIQLLEERIVSDRQRRKVGEVIIRKVVETQIVEVPVRREKLVIEQVGTNPKPLASIDFGQDGQPVITPISDRVEGFPSDTSVPSQSQPLHQAQSNALGSMDQPSVAPQQSVSAQPTSLHTPSSQEANPITAPHYISAHTAQQILSDLSQQLDNDSCGVRLEFADASLQRVYEQGLENASMSQQNHP
ncbi:MAG TPA: DUF2382 domain-containing protein [Candidatus Obscuribacterales bacterium]